MKIAPFRSLVLGTCLLIAARAAEPQFASTHVASYEATRAFWETIHQAFVTQPLIDSIKQLRIGDTDEAHARMVRQALRTLAKAALEKNSRVTSLPLLKVDVDAVAFATKAAQFRVELASLCELIAAKVESDERVPNELASDFLLGLIARANDKEGSFWSVAKESLGKGYDATSKMHAEWVSLAARGRAFSEHGNTLQIDEMTTRSILSSRYQHEFPPASSFPHIISEQEGQKR